MEQGRVNDAARVGQSADLVVAPLFLLCFFFLSAAPFVVFLSLRAGLSRRFLYFFCFFCSFALGVICFLWHNAFTHSYDVT